MTGGLQKVLQAAYLAWLWVPGEPFRRLLEQTCIIHALIETGSQRQHFGFRRLLLVLTSFHKGCSQGLFPLARQMRLDHNREAVGWHLLLTDR